MAQPEKIEAVADLKVKLEEKPNFILVSYSGLNVKLMEELRQVAELAGHRVTAWGDKNSSHRRVESGGWMS